MGQLFDDEILSVVLRFANPNRQDMLDADKVAARLSLSLDNVIRRAVSAGKSVGDIFDDIKKLEPALKSLEKRSGLIQGQAGALKSAHQILARYTPARLEKMAEVQAAKIAETSGTASLRRQLEKHGDLVKRLVATQEGRYDRATRGSNVGRALFIDTETTGLNALKHQIVELTATLFSFNKKTGEVVNAAERTYHGFQQLDYQSKHQYMPTGLSAKMLQGQAISTAVLKRLIDKADFLVAHNAPFDKKFVEKVVPHAAGSMWLDTMRGIPWKTLGFKSRALQDLLRANGIESGTAHRTTSDVSSSIKLLGSHSPLGGPSYMSMLLAGQGPLNKSQQMLSQVKSMAEELRSNLQSRLGESDRPGFSRPVPRQKTAIEKYFSRSSDDISEVFSKQIITAIDEGTTARSRRPARTTDYGIKKSSGVAPESTPGLLGESAISIDRRIGSIDEFLRNMAMMSGPAASGRFLADFSRQQIYQEKLQQSRGRGRTTKEELRTGDDVALASMTGLNTRLENTRLNIASPEKTVDPSVYRMMDQHDALVSQMLSQPWAKPPQKSVYIAGPMRGLPELNFPAFDSAEQTWRKKGWGVVNPAQMDREQGYVPAKDQTVFKDLSIEEAMSRDLPAVAGVHAIALLKGWERSQGAKMELQHAIERRKEIYDAETGKRLRLRDVRSGLGEDTISQAVSKRLPVSALKREPTTIFRSREISDFANKHAKNPSVESIRTAAQMASHVGSNDPRFATLTRIVLKGQYVGRKIVEAKSAESQLMAAEKLAHSMSGGSTRKPLRGVPSEALRGLQDAGLFNLGSERGSIPLDAFMPWKWGKRKQEDSGPKMSAEEHVSSGMPLPDPVDTAASIRRDALDSKLRKLADTVEKTTKAFQHYRDVIAPEKLRKASIQYGEKVMAIDRGFLSTNASIESQAQRIEDRRAKNKTAADRRRQDLITRHENLTETLGFTELKAEYELDIARRKREIRAKQLQRVRDSSGRRKYNDEDIKKMTEPIVQRAQMSFLEKSYKRQAAQLGVDPNAPGSYSDPRLRKLREGFAEQYAVAAYGPGKETEKVREEFSDKVLGTLGAKTPIQQTAIKAGRVSEDAATKEKELDAQAQALRQKRVAAEEKASQQRATAETKFGETANKVEADVQKRAQDGVRETAKASRLAHEAKVAYLKKEEAILSKKSSGRGAGMGGGGGAGGGYISQLFGGESRGGMGFGVGLAAIVAYDEALKTLIKDSAIYSARTEMMEFATKRMAQVSGLNVQEVDAEVEAIKRLNVTTQVAHQTVQRMMMMQIDLAKATKLVSVAQDLAAVSGSDAMETISRLSQAVLTGYTRNLHMMGLQVTSIGVMRELKAQRRTEGKTGEPSIMEQRQALVNKVILDGARVAGTYERSMSTAGGQFAYLRKEIQETMNVLGKEFLPLFSQTMSSMSGGLRYVQGHAEGFATLTKVLTSLGVTLNVLGTLSFVKWMIGGSKILSKAAPLLGVAAGVGTYLYLDQDKSKANKSVASDQRRLVNERVASLQKEREELMKSKDGSAAWKNSWEINTKEMASYATQMVGISEDLTKKLAEQYNEQVKNLDNLISVSENKHSTFAQRVGATWGVLKFDALGIPRTDLPDSGKFGESVSEKANRRKKQISSSLAKDSGVSTEDIEAEAARQQEEASRVKLLSPKIVNEMRQKVAMAVSAQQGASELLEKYSKKVEDVHGQISLKALKSLGTPREKAQLDYEAAMAEIDQHFREIKQEEAKATSKNPKDAQEYQEYVKATGSGDFEEGKKKIAQQKADRVDVENALRKNLGIELGKINAQTQIQINQIHEQTQVEQILAGVIKGNYASEEAGITAVLALKTKNLEVTKKLIPGAIDQIKITEQQNKAEAEQSRIRLEAERKLGGRERQQKIVQHDAERRAQDVMAAPGPAEEAIRGAFQERLSAAASIDSENRSLDEQLSLQLELDDVLVKLGRDRQKLAAESRIAVYEDQQDLIMQVDRIVGSRGKSSKKRATEEIARTRLSQIAIANKQYNEMVALRPPDGTTREQYEEELGQQKKRAERQADSRAALDTLKVMEDRVQFAVSKLHDLYQQRISDQAKISELSATSGLEEQTASYNTYQARLQYVQKEFEARKKAGDALDEIERARDFSRHEIEMEYLQQLLQQKRQQVDTIRNVSGNVFDIVTSRSPNKQQQAKDYAVGLAKGMGRTVFSNLAVEVLKSQSGALGGIIKGQEKNVYNPQTGQWEKKPTFLGKILSGTPFGKTATDKQIEAQKAIVKATRDNITAEDSLTAAIKSLDEAVRAAKGLVPGDKQDVTTTTKIKTETQPSKPVLLNTIPIFGGPESNPLIYHFNSGAPSRSNDVIPVNIMQVAGSGLSRAVPVYLVTSPMGQATGSLPSMLGIPSSGGSGSSSGSDTMSSLVGFLSKGISGLGGGGGGDSSSGLSGGFGALDDKNTTAAGASPPGATWPGTDVPVPSGSGGSGGSGGGGGGGGAGGLGGGGSESGGNFVKGALLIGTGAYQAYTGFKKGGGGGIASGIGGVLTAAAGVTSMIPGAQVATPFLMAGAMAADLIGSILGNSREQRGTEIQKYLDQNKYIEPTRLGIETSMQGTMVSTSARGQLSRDTGVASFPIDFTKTQYGKTPSKTWADPNIPEYYTIPGQINYGKLPGNTVPSIPPAMPGPLSATPNTPEYYVNPTQIPGGASGNTTTNHVSYTINLPISAFDTKDVMARSGDIASALRKEIQRGNDIGVEMKKGIFGAGMV